MDSIDLAECIKTNYLDSNLNGTKWKRTIKIKKLEKGVINSFESKGKKVNYIIETELMDEYKYE